VAKPDRYALRKGGAMKRFWTVLLIVAVAIDY